MTYSKGNWRVAFGDEVTTSEEGITEGSKMVASCANSLKPRSEVEANAHLIAAAPDMAEALKAVLEELLDQEKMPIMSNVYRKAQAAYHKATGEYAEAYDATAKGK